MIQTIAKAIGGRRLRDLLGDMIGAACLVIIWGGLCLLPLIF